MPIKNTGDVVKHYTKLMGKILEEISDRFDIDLHLLLSVVIDVIEGRQDKKK